MIGIRDDDAGRGSFPAKPVKLSGFQQDWIDKVSFSGGYDRAGTEVGLYRGIVILPDEEVGNRLVKIASNRHVGASLGDLEKRRKGVAL